jgi:hypothetical protein
VEIKLGHDKTALISPGEVEDLNYISLRVAVSTKDESFARLRQESNPALCWFWFDA